MIQLKNQNIDDQSSQRFGNDVPKYMVKTEKRDTGVFFGREANKQRYVGKPQDRDGHVLVVGGAGSGKSTCIAIPTLTTWGGTIFVWVSPKRRRWMSLIIATEWV